MVSRENLEHLEHLETEERQVHLDKGGMTVEMV